MNGRTTRLVTASALACHLALALTGCGGGRQYTTPPEACGVPVAEESLDPFLVDGEEVGAVGDSLADPTGTYPGNCELRVDGRLVFGAHLYAEEELVDPMSGGPWTRRFDAPQKMENLPFRGLGAVDGRRAMISAACGAPAVDHLVLDLYTSPRAGGDEAERRRDVTALALGLVPEMKKRLGCTE
ncbi:hypothetical protein LUW75_11335 [Streptomyces sp. MRC013]|uniref:hypothetical protein n=1 Tax=Streptomyces sp. MRC013 TaxID=2898276 RepID=UPI0020273DD4|nr:hypothetical protein [Streptomyces sp. MRC013]URM90498.1 hypothetical protein LUW75_11335 [Streptomyces sp. MRC013]